MTARQLLSFTTLSALVMVTPGAHAPGSTYSGTPQRPPPATGKVNFDTDIKPILTAHCIKCHGPEKQKGGLRLDTRKDALEGGNSGAVIVSGKSAESRLIHLAAGVDPDTK